MKIICCYTAAHERLFHDFFKPSLPAGLELDATFFDDLPGPGDFLNPEYIYCLHRKIDLIVSKLEQYQGEIVVCSDIDILFLRPVQDDLKDWLDRENLDIAFQSESKGGGHGINGGFYACRAGQQTIEFFQRVKKYLEQHPRCIDQAAINHQLHCSEGLLRWGYLPRAFYARTHGWPPPRDLAIYHANETVGHDGVGRKIAQFKELRWMQRHGTWARLWSCVTKLPKRLSRIRRQLFSAATAWRGA